MLTQSVQALDGAARRHRYAIERKGASITKDPGITVDTARDKHRAGTRAVQMLSSVLGREHIARTNHGNLDRIGNLIDDRPVGLARVELRGATTMHGDCGSPCALKHLGKCRGIAVLGIKALADLDGHGHVRRAHRGLDDLLRQVGRAHERRTLALGNDLAGGACHIDIDERQAVANALLDGGDGARKLIRFGAKELHTNLLFLVGRQHQAPRFVAGIGKACHAHHLAVGKVGTAAAAHDAVGGVGHARHGSHKERLLGIGTQQPLAVFRKRHGPTRPP